MRPARAPSPTHVLRRLFVVALLLTLAACTQAAQHDRPQITDIPPGAEQHHYAIESKGTLCGYAHVVAYPAEIDGRELTLLRQKMVFLMSALGAELNTELDHTYHLDPATSMYVYAHTDVTQGRAEFSWEARIDGNTAHVESTLGGQDATIELPEEIVLPGTLYFPHLKRDFVDGGLEQRDYAMLEIRDAEVRKVSYRKLGNETIELAGQSYDAVVLDELHPATGVRLKIWIDTASGQMLQGDLPAGRRFYLSEPRVVRKIEVANLDQSITSRVGVLISDFQSISYMKVRAVFQPTGLALTPEMLNVPGQKFTGTVEANRVEGVFEIRHPRYAGAGAPPFPPAFGDDPALREYLEPGDLIESDDAVLIAHARELTAGAADSWDAARRISTWVAENIDYAIPGGATARRTYDSRAGECGAHSALVAALCRAVGIPARVVWGCQYIPNYGGAFGQHGWNEIYMGRAQGWVPLDATSFEPDYVDSGHVRIGDLRSAATALNPVEMEVLEYRLGNGELVTPQAGVPVATPLDASAQEKYGAYVGDYTGPGGRPFRVKVDHDALVVEVVGQVALPLGDPGPDGVWPCKIAPHVSVSFDRDEAGEVVTMWIHERVRMRKSGEPDEVDREVPEALRGHLGDYLLAAINAEFRVAWRHGGLAIRDPTSGHFARLERDPDDPGTWISQNTGNRITFQTDARGAVEGLTVFSRSGIGRN